MNVKSITLALLIALLPVGHARAVEPEPEPEPGEELRAVGIILTGAGGAFVLALLGLMAARTDQVAGLAGGDERGIAIGLGAAGFAALGVGIPVLIAGQSKLNAHRAKLEVSASSNGARVGLSVRF